MPAYDAMGNVHALMTVASATINSISYSAGDIVAAYDGARECGDGSTARLTRRVKSDRHRNGGRMKQYDAFGKTLRESGAYAANNPFRFSTKYHDLETGLVYYGHRYYSPSLGRFINRDPIEEQGRINLYSFVGNNGVNAYDYLGMNSSWYQWDAGTDSYYWVEGDGMDGQDHAEANLKAANTLNYIAQAESAMSAAMQVRNQTALAMVVDAINSDKLTSGGKITAKNTKAANRIASAVTWVVGSMNASGSNFIKDTVSSTLFTVDLEAVLTALRESDAPNSASAQNSTLTVGNNPGALNGQYVLNQPFTNERDAAIAVANHMRSEIGEGLNSWEYGAGIYRQVTPTADGTHYETTFRVTPITPGFESSSGRLHWYTVGDGASQARNPLFTSIINGRVPGATMVSYIHNHPAGSNRFSTGDMDFALTLRINAYVLTSGSGLLSTPLKQIEWPPSPANLAGTPVVGGPEPSSDSRF